MLITYTLYFQRTILVTIEVHYFCLYISDQPSITSPITAIEYLTTMTTIMCLSEKKKKKNYESLSVKYKYYYNSIYYTKLIHNSYANIIKISMDPIKFSKLILTKKKKKKISKPHDSKLRGARKNSFLLKTY